MNKVNRRRLKWAAVLVFSAVCLLYIAYWYISTNPLSIPTKYSFQYYNPTKLPAGFAITAKRIDIGLATNAPVAEMNLRTEDWVYEISESDGGLAEPTTTEVDVNNYTPNSVKPTCTGITSSQKQYYRLCHWLDYGRISVYEVKFMKYDNNHENPTFIVTEFPSTKDRIIDQSEIDNYVDSFVKARASGFKLLNAQV